MIRTRLFTHGIMSFTSMLLLSTHIDNTFAKNVQPNIVLIIADDLGWYDVGFHGYDQIQTPNIDLLAYTGIPLERYYTHSLCTPSRAALLTGKFAYTMGMQGYPLTAAEDRGLPLTEKILPQYLKELGYATHLVGKWHVGGSRTAYLPTQRGFDTHFGCRQGYIDYYEYVLEENWSSGPVSGFDLHRNLTVVRDAEGYVTDLYTNEAKTIIRSHDVNTPLFLTLAHNAPHSGNDGALLQAPPDVVRTMRYIESPERRIFAGMVKKLDDSVGEVVEALSEKGILDNTIIVFISDNGGMTSGSSINYASNWPLRGLKFTHYEGGVRVAGLLWSPLLNPVTHAWKGYFHVVDWLPTLLGAVGVEVETDIDGINLWHNFFSNNTSKDKTRNEFFEVDDYLGYASVTQGDFKLVTGAALESYSNHQGEDLRGIIGEPPAYVDTIKGSKLHSVLEKNGILFDIDNIKIRDEIKIECTEKPEEKPCDICYPQNGTFCLFNIKEDPCERHDISAKFPKIAENLLARLTLEMKRVIPRQMPLYRDPRGKPSLHDYAWTTWADNL